MNIIQSWIIRQFHPGTQPNIRIGRLSKLLTPVLSSCFRCETTWAFVKEHSTRYGDLGQSVFPLCDKCWRDLTIYQRLPYYRQLWDYGKRTSPEWGPDGRELLSKPESDWQAIEQAVLEGK